MRDVTLSHENGNRIQLWMFVLLMRLYGQNIYSNDSYIWKVFELDSLTEIDEFFSNVLRDFKSNHQDIARLLKIQQRMEDILSR